jgi:uncharacterized protein (TIGR02145 family)
MNCHIKIPSRVIWFTLLTFSLSSCKKDPSLPSVTTAIVSDITMNSAISGGNVTGDGGATVTARGVCWNTTGNPTIADELSSDGSGIGAYTSSLSNLNTNTTYYVRSYATNSAGTAYGNQIDFTTFQLAYVSTSSISDITKTSATVSGNVIDDYGSEVTARGICWTSSFYDPRITDNKTVEGGGPGEFTSIITGLTEHTLYNVRAYATSAAGTSYGELRVIITMADSPAIIFNPDITYGTVADIDGNNYKTVEIAQQSWMAENLRTTRFNDGTDIPIAEDPATWMALTTPGYCWYNNDESSFKSTYGGLYNWYAVSTGKLCPTGWHVPSNEELDGLVTFLGGMDAASVKIRETGTGHWLSPNDDASNLYGFTAIPGGVRFYNGEFVNISIFINLWTSTDYYGTSAWSYQWGYLGFGTITGSGTSSLGEGESIRCIKDNPTK